jgi:hypothetical protein
MQTTESKISILCEKKKKRKYRMAEIMRARQYICHTFSKGDTHEKWKNILKEKSKYFLVANNGIISMFLSENINLHKKLNSSRCGEVSEEKFIGLNLSRLERNSE